MSTGLIPIIGAFECGGGPDPGPGLGNPVGTWWRVRHTGSVPDGGIWDFLATPSAAGFVSENTTITGMNYGNSANRNDIRWLNGNSDETGWTAAGSPSGDPWQGGTGRRTTGSLSVGSGYSIALDIDVTPRAIRMLAPSANPGRIPPALILERSDNGADWTAWATLTTTGAAANGIYDFLSITESDTIAATES